MGEKIFISWLYKIQVIVFQRKGMARRRTLGKVGILLEQFKVYLCRRTTMGEDVYKYVFENSDDDEDDSTDSDQSQDEQILWSE